MPGPRRNAVEEAAARRRQREEAVRERIQAAREARSSGPRPIAIDPESIERASAAYREWPVIWRQQPQSVPEPEPEPPSSPVYTVVPHPTEPGRRQTIDRAGDVISEEIYDGGHWRVVRPIPR